MGTLSALLFATPIFGFALTAPASPAPSALQPVPQFVLASPLLMPEVGEALAAEEGGESGEGEGEEGEATEPTEEGEGGEGTTPEPVEVAPPPPPPPVTPPEQEPEPEPLVTTTPTLVTADTVEDDSAEGGPSFAAIAAAGERRSQLRRTHRALGIATWLSMAATLTIGAIQFADKYGASEYNETRCAQGTATMGQWNCDVPYFHIFSIISTSTLYAATMGLSMTMADTSSGQGQSGQSRRLRMHRTLRWVHFAGMAAQILEGLIFANLDNSIDPEDNHGTLRGLNAFHLAIGTLTFAALTWAGGLMIAN